jgi:hypothetical protein
MAVNEPVRTLTFAEWREFESQRIASIGLSVQVHTPEAARDWIEVQIAAALRVAYAHGRDGLGTEDNIRTVPQSSGKK